MERDYSADIKIDQDNLTDEWIKQPSLYLYYAEAHADAVLAKEKASDTIDLVYAQLDSVIRKDWEKHFDKYPTETAIKNWILMQEKHKIALEKYHKISHTVNVLAAAKTAFDHRRKALENLVSLLITGFHSEPKVSKQITRRSHLGLRKKQ
jgi:hypothetical protein